MGIINRDLKKRLANYREEQKDQWGTFKSEFNQDMKELDKEFNDLLAKNS
jgi:hypothetical protein